MKVIDLLNKIANGEEVPTTIKYQDDYYNLIKKYNEDWGEYEFGYKNLDGGYLNIWRDNVLNDEVKILEEEKKIPEKLNYQYRNLYGRLSQHKQSEIDIIDTLNYVIDYLKSKGDE